MDSKLLAEESYKLMQKNFELATSEIESIDFDKLLVFLWKEIIRLLDHDFNQLMNILYRIDVSEIRVKQILQVSKPEELANDLTVEILERMRQKAITRIKYKS